MADLWDLRTDLLVGSTWTDITGYVRRSPGVTIARGRGSEGSTSGPQTSAMVLDNRDYRFSLRRPTGPYYGLVGRNTQLRQSLPASASYLDVFISGYYASCPDSAGISITGDIDLRADVWLPTWRPDADTWLIFKFTSAGNQRSYGLSLNANGTLRMNWSEDGATALTADSTAAVPAPISGRRSVRVTLDVNNGASGRTITFYTDATGLGLGTQLGDPVVQAGTTSIYNGTGSLYTWLSATTGRVYGAKVLQGIAGTERANPDFTTETDGTTSFADDAGNTWTVATTGARINGRDWRFWGEVPEWPPRPDISGRDSTVAIAASGIMRRLSAREKPLKSVYRRGCTSPVAPVQDLVAYWPMEDAVGSTSFASGIPGGRQAAIIGSPTLASDSTSFPCSAPLPVMTTGAAVIAPVTAYTATGEAQVWILVHVPAAGMSVDSRIALITTSGSAARWNIVVTTSGGLTVQVEDAAMGVLDTYTAAFTINGDSIRLALEFEQVGADIEWALVILEAGQETGYWSTLQTITGETVGQVNSIIIGPDKNLDGVTVGHITVQAVITTIYALADQLAAYVGETACARVARLCAEEDIDCRVIGAAPGVGLMGAQGQETLLTLLRECEDVDGGILYEPTDFLGLAYRSARSLCNQTAGATLDYDARQISPPFEPTDDDKNTLNDLTLSRKDGSSYRYVQATGSMSTADPPAGVGIYDAAETVNVIGDDTLPDAASWRVHLGTVDEPRFPAITVNLSHPTYTGSAALTAAVTDLDVGDRVDITDPPDDLPPDDVRQLAIGYEERITGTERTITLVGQPESPWRVVQWGASTARYGSDATTLAEDLTTTEPDVTVTIAGGRLWGYGDGDFDIMIGGERMTVTAVSGASSPQTFTVTRTVNGVVKTHSTGAQVTLADPRYWAP